MQANRQQWCGIAGWTSRDFDRHIALGFPALRGAPSANPSGVAPVEAPLPEPADLLPMVKGEVDRRLGSFKQWLINVLEQAGPG